MVKAVVKAVVTRPKVLVLAEVVVPEEAQAVMTEAANRPVVRAARGREAVRSNRPVLRETSASVLHLRG